MAFKMHKFAFIPFLLMVFLVLILICCKPGAEPPEIQNLRAFAKLYGYIRYFHPSDEASRIDWNRFVIYGVEKVNNAKDQQELKYLLEELFLSLAPTIQIFNTGEKPAKPKVQPLEDTTGLKVVIWQHRGLGSGKMNSPYLSIRLNKENILKAAFSGVLTQGVDATLLRGKEIKLTASVRAQVQGMGNQGHLMLKVDRENKQRGFLDSMSDRPIRSGEWNVYEINGKVADDATMIFFGSIMNGVGKLWLDEFKLFARSEDSEWEPVGIKNPGFELDDAGKQPKLWGGMSQGYRYKVQEQDSPEGEKCLLIENMGQKITGPIFEKYPAVGDVVNKELATNLTCQIPLALYADEKGTLGTTQEYSFDKLVSDLEKKDFVGLTANNRFVRLADVMIAWNVFQHFYPYFDVVDVDWDQELTNALKSALEDETEKDFFYTLSRMVAKLQDGHGNVIHNVWMQQTGLPIKVDWIENQVVVTVSKDPSLFQRGDIILDIDGIGAEKALRDAEEYISGSPQWKRWKCLNRFGYGEPGTSAKLRLKRGERVLEMEVERNFKEFLTESTRPNIEKLENRIYYVNLDKASWLSTPPCRNPTHSAL